MAQTLVSTLVRSYQTHRLNEAHRAMLEAGLLILRDGEAAVGQSRDPFGDGPFVYRQFVSGFELTGKLNGPDGKPATLRFGQ